MARAIIFDEAGNRTVNPPRRRQYVCSNSRIAVYKPGQDKPFHSTRYRNAKKLVDSGKAEFINLRSIRMIYPDQIATSSALLQAAQGKTYESAAIDPNPRFFQGGLTRNEHRPAPIKNFQAARVSHQ